MRIAKLRCEYLENPLGIDELAPRLSWILESPRRGARQAARRIRVASTAEKLRRNQADLWDSGRVADARTAPIAYEGRPLASRQVCHWKVTCWDETGAASESPPARWTMGLLRASDWKARWIAADPAVWGGDPGAVAPGPERPGSPVWFRREFEAPAGLKRATLYASARGVFEAHLGGRKVGEDLFAPEWTDYRRRIQYRTYNVTGLVAPGPNVLGAVLGDGWYGGFLGWQRTRARYGSENSLLLQLELETGEGKRIVIGTDRSWAGRCGPILSSDFQMGEEYDARRELEGWGRLGGGGAGWLPARAVAAPRAALVAQRSEPVRITELLAPQSVRRTAAGAYICDLGQNISGWVRLRVRAPAGTRVVLRHAERLSPDGSLYTENLRRARSTDVYVARGAARETWEPRFTFHGFQYVEISGLRAAPRPGDVTGCALHSAAPPAGEFACSHEGVNRLWLNGRWSQRDNFISVPTDCPQRDERLGWTGDAQVFLRTASCNLDVAAFFTKWMIDVEDAQTPEGVFPDTAPRLPEDGGDYVGLDGLGGAAGWADAGVVVPWTLWQVYGDLRVAARHWKAMAAWLAYLERTNPDGVRRNELGNNYGDWLCLPSDRVFREGSPMKTLLATAYWADDAAKLAELAAALGRPREAKRYRRVFERVRAAFQREFLRGDGRLAVETQTAYLLALAMDLLPAEVRARAAERLVDNIRALDWHLSTGFIGIRFLNPVLTETGHADAAWRLLLREDYPSWLYPVRHGATTIWERWNGWTEEGGFFNPEMNSFNHYALGSIGEWLFRHVAGIEPAEPGFRRIRLRPHPGGGLKFARAAYDTPHGRVESAWEREGEKLAWQVRVPPNAAALACIPSEPGTAVAAGGRPLERAGGVGAVRRAGAFVECELGPGRYAFASTLRAAPLLTP